MSQEPDGDDGNCRKSSFISVDAWLADDGLTRLRKLEDILQACFLGTMFAIGELKLYSQQGINMKINSEYCRPPFHQRTLDLISLRKRSRKPDLVCKSNLISTNDVEDRTTKSYFKMH
jgi:hypothetical protein